jgi:hypothetical protein
LPGAATIRFELPRQLFEGGFELVLGSQHAFDVGPDGRFLMIQAGTNESTTSAIVLVRNASQHVTELLRSK